MKRAKSSNDELTGGSGDVNPQYLSLPIVNQTVANTYFELAFPTPIPRTRITNGRATVMEMLRIMFNLPEADTNNIATGSNLVANAHLSTRALAAVSFANPAIFAYQEKNMRGAFTAAGTYGTVTHEPNILDLTDGAGHGILVATDNIYFGVNTIGFLGVAGFACKIIYRMKNVSVEEYVGIVQSQQ